MVDPVCFSHKDSCFKFVCEGGCVVSLSQCGKSLALVDLKVLAVWVDLQVL